MVSFPQNMLRMGNCKQKEFHSYNFMNNGVGETNFIKLMYFLMRSNMLNQQGKNIMKSLERETIGRARIRRCYLFSN